MVLWGPRSCSFVEMIIFPMFLRSLKLVCFEFRQEKYFPLVQIIQTVTRAHPPSYSIYIGGSFSGIRRPGHEVDHGTPFNVKVKNEWSYKFYPQLCFHVVDRDIQGGSNMTETDLYVNKPHWAAAVRPWESEATTSTLPPARVRTCSVLSGSC